VPSSGRFARSTTCRLISPNAKGDPMFTVTYFDSDTKITRRVVQDWSEKAEAKSYAKQLRKIFSQVKVVPVEQAASVPLSVDK
jgi:hypothetical protein